MNVIALRGSCVLHFRVLGKEDEDMEMEKLGRERGGRRGRKAEAWRLEGERKKISYFFI